MEGFCATCDGVTEVEPVDGDAARVMCLACGEEFDMPTSGGGEGLYDNYVVGLVLSVEPLKKDLKKVMVDVKGDGEGVQIVTNAKYIEVNWKVVVALENSIVPAGGSVDDGDAVLVKKTSVGGVMSHGMLCDSAMLNWTGGAKGFVQQLPDSFEIGSAPPSARPRVG
jgi:tRNA-binding EMAP/Myf-like protein